MNRLLAVTFACLALLWAPLAHAKLPERPAGPVYDGASIIPDDVEAGIDAKLRALSKDTGKTLVVATVPSLDGQEVEEYAVELFETWGVGDAEKDEGALILVAPNERRTRIEVGLGSEGILPDALAGRIIDQQMIPRFKEGDYASGIAAAADAVSEQLRREPTDAKAVAAAAERAERQGGNDNDGEIGMVIFWLFVFFFFILPVILSFARGGKKHRGKRRRDDDDDDDDWGGPVIIWGGSGGGSSWGGSSSSSWGRGGFAGGGGGGFGGFGGGMSGGGGASGGW
jgi:uncharacterized protein